MITFIETPLFGKLVYSYLTEDEFRTLQVWLLAHPESGDIIPRSGGVRKLRFAGKGKGKRGGLRVIYYWQKNKDEIWLLTLYAKNEEENIPAHLLRNIMEEFT